MPTLTIDYATESERLRYESAIAYVREMARLGATAAPGTVIDACEKLALGAGRELLRANLQAAVQARADAEKKRPATARRGVASAG